MSVERVRGIHREFRARTSQGIIVRPVKTLQNKFSPDKRVWRLPPAQALR
jgi:hypothetical protein